MESDTACQQDLPKIAWSCAKCKYLFAPLMNSIASASLKTISSFPMREIANTAWAFATLKFMHQPFMKAIAAAARPTIAQRTPPRNIANLSWSFSRLNMADLPLMNSLSAAAITSINQFKAQDIANTAWSCSPLRWLHAPLRTAISSASMTTWPDFCTQNIANLLWSVALLEVDNPPLLESISSAAMAKSTGIKALQLGNMAWAVAHMHYNHQPLLASISASALTKLSEFDVQGVAALHDSGLVVETGSLLTAAAAKIEASFPDSTAGWWSAPAGLLMVHGCDNIGARGAQQLLSTWDVEGADLDFIDRAHGAANVAGFAEGDIPESAGVSNANLWAFLECELTQPLPLSCAWVSASGRDGEVSLDEVSESSGTLGESISEGPVLEAEGHQPLLRAFRLPIRKAVDRAHCAEFKLLHRLASSLAEERAEPLIEEGSTGASGRVQIYVPRAPCLSCLAAMRQFQLLFPGVQLTFAGGKLRAGS
mmetsp:Transcript_123984/g.239082  ORF Transcript_123984/g.239082 Transcript_123984/m.239082 type:complete len:482 (+) Transcript_123984:272-1717(+)